MSLSVKKESFVNADEETLRALTHDMLDELSNKIDGMVACHKEQVKTCSKRITKIEEAKKSDTKKSSLFGFLGGFIAMILYYLKSLFE